MISLIDKKPVNIDSERQRMLAEREALLNNFLSSHILDE